VKRLLVMTVGLATFGLLAACADAPKISVTDRTASDSGAGADVTIPPGLSLPDLTLPDISIPDVSLPAISLPPDFTIPQETIDLMISQFEAAGMKVDRACFTKLLSDESLRKLVEDAGKGSGSLSPEIITKFLGCLSA
jgi:hypothetical protein